MRRPPSTVHDERNGDIARLIHRSFAVFEDSVAEALLLSTSYSRAFAAIVTGTLMCIVTRFFKRAVAYILCAAPVVFLSACAGSGATASSTIPSTMQSTIRTTQSAAALTSPTFKSVKARINTGGNLIISYTEVGLSPGEQSAIIASADVFDIWGCVDTTAKKPEATNEVGTGPGGEVDQENSPPAGPNGEATGQATVPIFILTPTCPANAPTTVLATVTFTNVVLSDATHSVTDNIKGNFSETFYPNSPI